MTKMYFVIDDTNHGAIFVAPSRKDAIKAGALYNSIIVMADNDKAFELGLKLLRKTKEEHTLWDEYVKLAGKPEVREIRENWTRTIDEINETYRDLMDVAEEITRFSDDGVYD